MKEIIDFLKGMSFNDFYHAWSLLMLIMAIVLIVVIVVKGTAMSKKEREQKHNDIYYNEDMD